MSRWTVGSVVAAVLLVAGLAQPARAATVCRMTFTLKSWSVFYQSATGQGDVICDNGQTARVNIRAKGGGLTVGKSKIVNGEGRFSEVEDIANVFGTYASADAHAGMGDSANAQVVTKGPVSLALSGTGKGVDVGIAFGNFVIEKVGPKTPVKKTN